MQEQSTLNKLSHKVSQLLSNYDDLRMENEQLNDLVKQYELDNASKDATIAQKQSELQEKDREIEEIVNKIESILG